MKLEDLQLQFNPPRIPPEEARQVVRRHYGIDGNLTALAGERDRNFRVRANDGRQFVFKISGALESDHYVDLQTATLQHLESVDPGLGTPRGMPLEDGSLYGQHRFAYGGDHKFRLVTFLEGRPLAETEALDARTATEIGQFQGRLCRALSSFFHGAAQSPMPWDLSNGLVLDEAMLGYADANVARLIEPHLDRLRGRSWPALKRQRGQVIHNDLHLGNLLVDGSRGLAGVIDFGDVVFAPLLQDLAVSATSLADARPDDPLGAIEALRRGFDEVFPLLPEETDLLLDATLLRSLLCVTLGRYKLTLAPDSSDQADVYATSLRGFEALLSSLDRKSGAAPQARSPRRDDKVTVDDLMTRRDCAMSPTYKLFYDEPLHLVRGRGTALFDSSGREYLDCYNNVPSVGHCHPHVVEALRRQAGELNTHTRYLHDEVVRYAERLTASLPDDIEMCLFACTGSEANDLAYQIARTVTGQRGAVASADVYHGNSIAISEVSQYNELPPSWRDHVRAIPVPDRYRGPHGADDPDVGRKYAALATDAIDALRRSPHGFAMLMVDPIFDSPGILTAPEGYFADLFQLARDAGGLVVADEVQSGLCRLGDNMWGFQDSNVVPDIVTMGKPMGNGHPLAVVAAKRPILEAFAEASYYFNTFGGNPVSAAVGNAVLDVVEQEDLLQNAHDVGQQLWTGLVRLQNRFEILGDLRGKGLFLGLDLVTGRDTKEPASGAAHALVNTMRRNGVLVTVSGPHDNVIKVRPPLVFSSADASRFLDALETGLSVVSDQT